MAWQLRLLGAISRTWATQSEGVAVCSACATWVRQKCPLQAGQVTLASLLQPLISHPPYRAVGPYFGAGVVTSFRDGGCGMTPSWYTEAMTASRAGDRSAAVNNRSRRGRAIRGAIG
jgi:hypothetical protein